MTPAIFGLSGPIVTAEERAAIQSARPAGIILFKRNVETRHQLRALTDDLRDALGREKLAILIDQEGGAVARLTLPEWPKTPAAARFSALYDRAPMTAIEAARINAEATALMLAEVGITINCAPMLDRLHDVTHASFVDRLLGNNPAQIAALGRAILNGLKAGGVAGVIKHMPGHGRAQVDSHHDLPRISVSSEELEADLAAFAGLADAPIGMTGHILFETWDEGRCATHSPTIIEDIIRGKIGFDGLLLSDDLHMEALSGALVERAVAAVAAGCDLALACHATPAEMEALADALPPLSAHGDTRLNAALSWPSASYSVDNVAALMDKRDALLAYAG